MPALFCSCSHCCWLSCDDSFDVRGKNATRPSFFALAGVLIMHAPTIEVASSRSSLALGGEGQSCCLAGSSCPEPKKKKSQSVRPLCLGGGGARERPGHKPFYYQYFSGRLSRSSCSHNKRSSPLLGIGPRCRAPPLMTFVAGGRRWPAVERETFFFFFAHAC